MTRMVNNIQDRCTYRDGVCCGSLWKGNKHAWEKDGREILDRLIKGVERLRIVGFDSEGNGGVYHQIAWLGEDNVEVLVIGPKFFPTEI